MHNLYSLSFSPFIRINVFSIYSVLFVSTPPLLLLFPMFFCHSVSFPTLLLSFNIFFPFSSSVSSTIFNKNRQTWHMKREWMSEWEKLFIENRLIERKWSMSISTHSLTHSLSFNSFLFNEFQTILFPLCVIYLPLSNFHLKLFFLVQQLTIIFDYFFWNENCQYPVSKYIFFSFFL